MSLRCPSQKLQIFSEDFTQGKRDGARVRVLTPNQENFKYLVPMSFNLGIFGKFHISSVN
jgi:hypothetical protein